jgi:Ca2+-transporting ATPase
VRALHAVVPGRLRLRVGGLFRHPAFAGELCARLAQQPGLYQATANARTGNLLIRYDPALLAGEVIAMVQRLAEAGLRPDAAPADDPTPASPAQPAPGAPAWHTLDADTALTALDSGRTGLTPVAASSLLQRHGANRLPGPQPRSAWDMVFDQFRSLPVLLLLAAAVLSIATGGLADAAVILGVVLLNAGIGFVTESQTERTLQMLIARGPQLAQVVRGGRTFSVDAETLVPGDILLLAPGERVAADVRLIAASHLSVDESPLTGESVPALKSTAALAQADTPLADRLNMAHMGTMVTGGSGQGVVVATGVHSQIGAIQAMVNAARPPATPLQRQLDRLGTQLVWISAAICASVFGIGLLRGFGWLPMLSSTVALAVAAVPEGLPAVATTTLALGIRRMRSQRVLIRQLAAVETLGAVEVLCLDKTGTLTMNRMRVHSLQCGGESLLVTESGLARQGQACRVDKREEWLRLLQVAVLCNETELLEDEGRQLRGSPTESALVQLALDCGIDVAGLRRQRPLRSVEYRAEGRNYMRTVHRGPDSATLYAVKGSPPEVLTLCRWRLAGGVQQELDEAARNQILAHNAAMAGSGLRVLGFAYGDEAGEELVWLGLAGLEDPLRPGMIELMAQLHRAGIKTVMITGDQSATAFAVGKALHLAGPRALEIMDSSRLDRLEPELLARLVDQVDVFARVSPRNKLHIVEGLQSDGRVVAMTGDGINDGPALRVADIGVALGRSGTDTARAVADVVIEDDELSTLVAAVGQGRAIYDNIRKTVHFLLSTNGSELLTMLLALAAGLGQPLNTRQLLWINLLSDVFPALALAVEPPEPDVLERPPRDPGQPIMGAADLKRYLRESGLLSVGALAGYGYGLARYGQGARAGSLAFNTLVLGQLLHALTCRSERYGLFARGNLPHNRYLDMALGASGALHALALTVPRLRRLLGTTPPVLPDLAVTLAGAALPLLVNELVKAGTPTPSAGSSS